MHMMMMVMKGLCPLLTICKNVSLFFFFQRTADVREVFPHDNSAPERRASICIKCVISTSDCTVLYCCVGDVLCMHIFNKAFRVLKLIEHYGWVEKHFGGLLVYGD